MSKIITVFGSSVPKPGEEEYETAYKLGKLLAKNNFDVCSGGYYGIMDAVSKGAAEGGSKAIGITVKTFNRNSSEYLTEEIVANTLFERIDKLIEIADGYIVLRGGTGTLVELSVVWEYINKDIMELKPIACHGKMWQPLVEEIDNRMKFERRKTGVVKHFSDIHKIVEFLSERLR